MTEGGYTIIELMIVSVIVASTFLLTFQMLNHFSLWWKCLEERREETCVAKNTLLHLSEILFMTGYRPSVKGIHSIGENSVTVEYLDEEADESPGEYSRHRRYEIFQDGDALKLTTCRRALPLEGTPAWRSGSTTVLAEGVHEACFTYLDEKGEETEAIEDIRMIVFSLNLETPALPGKEEKVRHRYRTAVFLRNYRG